MKKRLLQSGLLLLIGSFLFAPKASTQLLDDYDQTKAMQQVNSVITSVNQLQDVEPSAWAYEALRSLVERYRCSVGYPTYRGNRALTRWEFAAGLNTCLNTIKSLIHDGISVLKEDIDKLQRLAREFETELAVLGTRLDNLEQRVAFLEDHQFSTTSKLRGEVIFVISDTFGNKVGTNEDQSETTFENRVRLSFESSFTGKDLLRVRLQANSTPNYSGVTGTDMARLGFDSSNNDDIVIDDLFYRFALGNQITGWVGTHSLDLDDIFNSTNPYLESSSTGSVSRFLRYNPLTFRGPQGSGLGVKFSFSQQFYLTTLYLVNQNTGSNPFPNNGLFNGSYSTGVQLGFNPFKELLLTFNYLHAYETDETVNITSSTGSSIGKRPFGSEPTSSDRFGLQMSWKLADFVHFGGWFGYGTATAEGGSRDGDTTDLWTWSAEVSFLDLFKEGSVLTFAGGLPIKTGEDLQDSSYIIEAQYQYPITTNIIFNPSIFVVLNPEHNNNNDAIWVGVLRTSFRF